MHTLPTLLFTLTLTALATSACASTAFNPQAAPGAADLPATPTAQAEAETVPAAVPDPWEGFNRRVHGFNNAADEFVLRPLAVGYQRVVPDPVQAGVSRFFANLRMPATAVNQALQGRPAHAAQSLGRFVVNTTVGIAGVFDPASPLGMPARDHEDFGQTLATWGWQESRYLVLPLLGPRTLRDTVAVVGDQPLSPLGQIQDSGAAAGVQALQAVDGRSRMLPLDKLRREAVDDYAFVRDAWAQRRQQQIQQDLRSTAD